MQRLRELSAGVRVRTTAAAVLVVGAALVFASVYMVVKLRDSLTSGIHDAATLTAQELPGDAVLYVPRTSTGRSGR